jgi:hypothetical protein
MSDRIEINVLDVMPGALPLKRLTSRRTYER